jgi:hypothetical protein
VISGPRARDPKRRESADQALRLGRHRLFQDDCKGVDVIRGVVNAAFSAALFFGLAVLTVPACAQQFSADIVRTHAGGQPSAAAGKIYVSGNKVRIEMSEAGDGFFIVDAGAPASYFVRPSQRVYMDAKQSSPLTQLLVPVDVADPCRQWQTMSAIATANGESPAWSCERIGQGTEEGHETIEFRASWPKDRHISAWIDARLKWPVRLTMEDGTVIDLANIQEQPQPAALFEIPPRYRKFDPRALIERIKQSDVWVEPQH